MFSIFSEFMCLYQLDDPQFDLEDAPVALLTVVRRQNYAPIHYEPVNASDVLKNHLVTTHSQLHDAFHV